MSTPTSENQLPLSYSLPPPPPSVKNPQPSGRGRGRSRDHSYGSGYGRYQPLFRQSLQPGSNQPSRQQNNYRHNSQQFGGIYTANIFNSDKITKQNEHPLPNSVVQPQNPLKKQNNVTLSIDFKKDNKGETRQQVKSLTKTKKDTPQDQFISLLKSFNKGVHEVQEVKDNRTDLAQITFQQSDSSVDKNQGLSVLNENQESLRKQPNLNDQKGSNINGKLLSSNEKAIPLILPSEDEQDGLACNKDYDAGFVAAAKAALAATAALQYKDQKIDEKHNNTQKVATSQFTYQTNDQSEFSAANFKKSINDESRLKPVMDFHLDTPEAIAKWIEQRKKNYPTEANIACKKKLEAACIAHGKVLKAQAYKKRSLDQANGQSSNRATKKKQLENGEQENTEIDADRNGNAGPSGITDLLVAASAAGVILNADIIKTIHPLQSIRSRNQRNKERNLFQTVSDSTVSKKNKPIGKLYGQVCIKYRQDHCPRGKDCTNKHIGKMICPPIQRPPDNARCRQRNLRDLLLYKEIVEEKNVILQCIRHIVNKNFFGVVTDKAIKDAKKRGEALVVEVQQVRTSSINKRSDLATANKRKESR